MRFAPIQHPLATPYLVIASKVYCEQVGIYRHCGGVTCDIVIWYILIIPNAIFFIYFAIIRHLARRSNADF